MRKDMTLREKTQQSAGKGAAMGNKRVVLASASPRRSELLRQIGLVPEILVSHVEEKVSSRIPSQVVMELARQKAEDVAQRMDPGVIVIGADTVVAVDGRILGKPSDHEEAYQMACLLQGRRHQVYTGVCMIQKAADGGTDQKTVFYDETDVEVEPMSEEELREYSRMEEPMDKAGAYAVQGYFARYIKGMNGSYANVMGLPVHRVYQELKLLGFWEQAEEREHD